MLDEYGMPVPSMGLPCKVVPNTDYDYEETHLVIDSARNTLFPVWPSDRGEYFVHAANWIIPCREIVRRLATCQAYEWEAVAVAAVNLWTNMQLDAKGGDGE